jgi:hypothetical protein
MARAAKELKGPSVILQGDAIVLAGFVETDPEVVAVAVEADDPDAAIHRCLQVGARAVRIARVSMDTGIVERAFDRMTGEFDRKVDEAGGRISDVADRLFDDEAGDLRKSLDRCKSELGELLGDAFDPMSKQSILAKVESALQGVADQQLAAFRRTIDPDHEDSPLGRFRREIQTSVREQSGEVLGAVRDLSERLAIRDAEAMVFEKTTAKGFSFEDQVHAVVSRIAAAHADVAEQTGRSKGSQGTQIGDEVVDLDDNDTRGTPGRYVLEIKDRKTGLKAILDELDCAIANREALAGIAVFSRKDLSPVAVPFQYFGNRAIVVFDKNDQDEGALRLACMWARWVVRRQLAERCEAVDGDRVASLIDDVARSLARASKIRSAHSAARNKIDEAGTCLSDLVTEVETSLEGLRQEMNK